MDVPAYLVFTQVGGVLICGHFDFCHLYAARHESNVEAVSSGLMRNLDVARDLRCVCVHVCGRRKDLRYLSMEACVEY